MRQGIKQNGGNSRGAIVQSHSYVTQSNTQINNSTGFCFRENTLIEIRKDSSSFQH
jgi:hypothetical protein